MKYILFILVLILLLIFTNNKKEFFKNKIIGNISFEDYIVETTKEEHAGEKTSILDKFYSKNLLAPRRMTYTIGKEGIGPQKEITSLSFKPENVKNALGNDGIKKIGGTEIANLESMIPLIFYGSQKNYEKINKLSVEFEKIRAEMQELKKGPEEIPDINKKK